MYIVSIGLEVTRNCTLACEHCLRGDAQAVNMDLEVIEKIFNNVRGIGTLLLTGGEPLIAVQQLEKIIELIKKKNIKVGKITLITNGTIYSARVLRIIKELNSISYLNLKMSDDIFHLLELERLGLLNKRENTFSLLREHVDIKKYASEDEAYCNQLLLFSGRTKSLTQERLDEINRLVKFPYVTRTSYGEVKSKGMKLFFVDDTLCGDLSVDVYGNLVGYGLEFVLEDEEAKNHGINIMNMDFRAAIEAYIKYEDEKDILAAQGTILKFLK